MRLLITDLDNTLYDWVTFFAQSFRGMVARLVAITGISEDALLDEFKAIHQLHANSEYPFAVLELPSLRARFTGYSDRDLLVAIDDALHEFNRIRAQTLRLYDGVADGLAELRRRNVVIVGHTEAISINAYYRLHKLGIADFFTKLYALDGPIRPHPRGLAEHQPPDGLVERVPFSERKPNPGLLLDICERQGVRPAEAVYVGDSVTRDVGMALDAGVLAVWAKYGTRYDRSLWSVLVRVTHWSENDVKREEELRERYGNLRPDRTIEAFTELLPLFSTSSAACA